MRKQLRILVFLSASVASVAMGACGDTSDSDSKGIPLTDLPAKYAAELCSAFERCLGAELYQFFSQGSDCVERTKQQILNGEFAQYQTLIDAGKLHYDGTKLQGCLDAIHAKTCETLSERPVPECKAALDGTAELNADCDLNAECKGATFCQSQSGTCPGKCVALLVAGEACSSNDECASGLTCSGETQKCVQGAAHGQPCENGAPACAAGLLCIGKDGTANTPGTCKTSSETFAASEGEACDPRSGLCKAGLSCAVDQLTASGASLKCVKAGSFAAGAACKLAIPDACAAGNYCKTAGATLVVDGTCTPLPGPGEACGTTLFASNCAPNTVCVEGKCQSLVANGVSCFGDAMCYSGHCASNACQAKLPCD